MSCNTFVFVLTLCLFSAAATSSRPVLRVKPASTLLARLKLDGESSSSTSCWDSLFKLQSCTGEVILFFLNGETYLGKACCEAIQTIEHDCWPTMLTSLGYTDEEGFVLQGYCDGVKDGPVTPIHRQLPPHAK
uniref:Prolamin-like domain-containing protein n=1 Tax=Kalanchoe fedtschenkoi TaxID=63787 RepID=A0A7N0TPQ3_KALFE